VTHSTKKPTKFEQARLNAIHNMECIACHIVGVPIQPFPTEAHHIVDKGYRKHSGGHLSTLPLCGWHHRGQLKEGFPSGEMQYHYGYSFALDKKKFAANIGNERYLLEIVNRKLEGKL
jgi:hypothetical protein